MKLCNIILCTIVFILFFSCRNNQAELETLHNAESLLMQAPDSAIYLLSEISDPHKLKVAEQARYCLLYAAARFRNYEEQSDSMISIALKYYEKNGTKEQKTQAYYYMGCIMESLNDSPRSQRYYLKALNTGHKLKDYSLLGRIAARIAMLYTYQDAYEASVPYHKKALEYFMLEKDTLRQSYVLRDLGRTYSMLMHEYPDSAIAYYHKAISLATEEDRISFLGELGNVYTDAKMYDKAYECLFYSLENWSEEEMPYHLYSSYGKLHYLMGNIDSSYHYLTKSLERQEPDRKLTAYYYLIQIAKSEKRNLDTLNSEYIEILEEHIKQVRTDVIAKIDKLYNYQFTERELSESVIQNMRKKNIILICIILIVTLSVISIAGYNRIKKEHKIRLLQKERYSEWIEDIKRNSATQIEENKRYIRELELKLMKKNDSEDDYIRFSLEKEKLEAENKKIEYAEKEKLQLIKYLRISDVYQKFHSEKEWKVSEEDWLALEKIIHATYPRFFDRLKSMLPKMSYLEYKVCCLVKIQVPMQNIAQSINRSKQSVTMIRRRLYEKIYGVAASAKDFDDFIASL